MHALTGMWIANIAHSRRDPNHQFHRATMRFDRSTTECPSSMAASMPAVGRSRVENPFTPMARNMPCPKRRALWLSALSSRALFIRQGRRTAS